jgi:diaminohydroxyphosphoribosylaminopyrimidine deaminase/5-amino-6-(5-phosphoribosylamino)uracil reductase
MSPVDHPERPFMAAAARLALRGHGGAEPNPQVGCVCVSGGRVVGWGYHRRRGGPHAEVEALRRAGAAARGATVYVTLEPCNHTGRTGPCSEALIAAGVGRVVFARCDPTPAASGGARRLRSAGIAAEETCCGCPQALAVSEPYVHRVRSGLPWVVCKWAATLDGRIATRSGRSRWISADRSRRLVHRERGRVDAILTGIGTVRADDPMLTARGVRVRRVARRIVVDPDVELPETSRLVGTAHEAPTMIICSEDGAGSPRAAALRRAGVEILAAPGEAGDLDLGAALRDLARRHEVATVLVEAGPRLVGSLLRRGLLNELWVFTAPILLGDERAVPPVRGLMPQSLADGVTLELAGVHRRGPDVLLRYLIPARSPATPPAGRTPRA